MRLLWLLVLASRIALCGPKSSAADVVDLVMVSLATDHDDESLTRKLKSVQPSERLTGSMYFLSHQGAGPKALAALKKLDQRSVTLPPPVSPPVSVQPLPSDTEREALFHTAVEFASKYIAGLPDFLCDETTRRYEDSFARTATPDGQNLLYRDAFKSVLRFSSGTDNVEVVSDHKGHGPAMKLKPGQSISFGEFGSDLKMVLGDRQKVVLTWERWELFKGRRMAVLGYVVDTKNTTFTVAASDPVSPARIQAVRAPVAGRIYLDVEKGVVRRLTLRALKLPEAFEVKESQNLIDYGEVGIGGQTYMVPTSAILFMRGAHQRNRNEISFTNYRRFGAESVLMFTDSKMKHDGGNQSK